jgi:hypothetical protein
VYANPDRTEKPSVRALASALEDVGSVLADLDGFDAA